MLSGPIDIIKKSFKIFFEKKNLTLFLKIYAPLVPFAIFSLIQDSYLNKFTGNSDYSGIVSFFTSLGWLPILFFVIGVGYLIVSFWINAAGIKAVAGITGGQTIDIKEVLRFAWKKLWLFSLLSIVTGLIIGFGFLLLIIPGIMFLTWYQFASYELMTKETGVKASLAGSKNLVRGRFWKVLGRIFVFGLFQILVQAVFGAIPWGAGSVITPLFGGLMILPYFLLYQELSSGPSSAVNVS